MIVEDRFLSTNKEMTGKRLSVLQDAVPAFLGVKLDLSDVLLKCGGCFVIVFQISSLHLAYLFHSRCMDKGVSASAGSGSSFQC